MQKQYIGSTELDWMVISEYELIDSCWNGVMSDVTSFNRLGPAL